MKKYPLRQNQFYVDPLDLWCEKHPIIATTLLGSIVFTLIFLGCLL